MHRIRLCEYCCCLVRPGRGWHWACKRETRRRSPTSGKNDGQLDADDYSASFLWLNPSQVWSAHLKRSGLFQASGFVDSVPFVQSPHSHPDVAELDGTKYLQFLQMFPIFLFSIGVSFGSLMVRLRLASSLVASEKRLKVEGLVG